MVNQKQAAIEGVVASTQQDVATINAQALATSTATTLAAIAAADTDYVAGVKASLDTLKATVISFTDLRADAVAKDKSFATFMYYSNLFSNRTSGTIVPSTTFKARRDCLFPDPRGFGFGVWGFGVLGLGCQSA
ncbi:MAG: hypothetical protein U5M51_03000, partial [Emticicia sp.]|nr:hypothetical protein [Emticicia sp.]